MRKVDACLEWPPRVKARSAMTTGTKGRKHPENQDSVRVVNYPIIAECTELLFLAELYHGTTLTKVSQYLSSSSDAENQTLPFYIFYSVLTSFCFYIVFHHVVFPLSLTHLGPTAGPPMSPFEGRYLSVCQESRWAVHPLICITFWGVTQVCHRPWEPSETYFNPPALLLGGVASICFIYSPQQLEYSVPKDTWRKGGGGEVLLI